MTRAEVIKTIEKVGADFGWQMGKVGANYENGYMKAIRDCKAVFQKEDHIREDTKKVVTNADRIRNMTDEDLARFINGAMCNSNGWCDDCPSMRGEWCNGIQENVNKKLLEWLKEKVE